MAQQNIREDLEQRRDEVTRSLVGLSNERVRSYRLNSDALALDRAGVKPQTPQELEQLKANETAAHDAVRAAQCVVRDLDAEIADAPGGGFRSKFGFVRKRG